MTNPATKKKRRLRIVAWVATALVLGWGVYEDGTLPCLLLGIRHDLSGSQVTDRLFQYDMAIKVPRVKNGPWILHDLRSVG
jgi:hypothetical protein